METRSIIATNDSDIGLFDLDFYDPKSSEIKDKIEKTVNEEEYQEI